MPRTDLTSAIRAAETLTTLLDVADVGVRIVVDIQANFPMSSETRQAIQAIELGLQKELGCPVHLRLGVGLHVPEWVQDLSKRVEKM